MAQNLTTNFTQFQLPRGEWPEHTTVLRPGGVQSDVNCVITLANGNLFATASDDTNVRVYLRETKGDHLHVFRGHSGRVTGLAALGDDVFVSVSEDKNVITWQLGTKHGGHRKLHTLHASEPLTCVAKLSTTRFLVGTDSGKLLCFQHIRGQELQSEHAAMRAHMKHLKDIAVLDDKIVTVSGSKTVRVWHTASFELLRSLQHSASVVKVALSRSYIACAQENGEIRLYSNAAKFELVAALCGLQHIGSGLKIVADRMLVSCAGNFVTFTDIATLKPVARSDSFISVCHDMNILPDSRLIVCGGSVEVRCEITTVPDVVREVMKGHCSDIFENFASSCSTKILASSTNQRRDSAAGSVVQEANEDITKWADVGVTRSAVQGLDTPEISSMLSAYLIGYRARLWDNFLSLKKCLSRFFEDNGIDGSAFVQVTKNDGLTFCSLIYTALKEDIEIGERFGYNIKIKAFLRSLHEGSSII